MDVKPKLQNLNIVGEAAPAGAIPGNVPAFLMKLWRLVEDRQLDDIISWSQVCRCFSVKCQFHLLN